MTQATTHTVLGTVLLLAVAFPVSTPTRVRAQSPTVDFGRDVQPLFRQYRFSRTG